MTEPYTKRLLSADSHIVEPADLWLTRMDKKWRDKAPRIEALDESGDYIVIDGLRPRPLAFEGPMQDLKAQGMDIPAPKGFRYADNRPGSWDPHERLKDQDMDGVSGEVIYPGVGLTLVRAPDAEYLYACCRAYITTGWRNIVRPIRTGLKGWAWCLGWGHCGNGTLRQAGSRQVMLPAWVDDRPYNLPDWDPLWAALQDMNLIASIHIGGRDPFGRSHGPGAGGIIIGIVKFEMNETLQQIIWGGAPIRFPKLKWALVESGIGWIGAALGFMDHWWQDHKGWMEPRLPEHPSTYFHRQFYATFEDDRAGVLTRELMGVEHLMWGSDYPHTEGVWPFSRKQVADNFFGYSRRRYTQDRTR